MKRVLFLCILIVIFFVLVACGDGGSTGDGNSISHGSGHGAVVYSREHMLITEAGRIQDLWVNNERINYYFYAFIGESSHLVVASVLPDGTDRKYVNIPLAVLDRQIFAVNVDKNGNVETIAREIDEIVYTRYDTSGIQQEQQSFGNLSVEGEGTVFIQYANFTENGKIICTTPTSIGSSVFVLDINDGTHEGYHYNDSTTGISSLKDGSVIVAFHPRMGGASGLGLRIFDSETGLLRDFHQSNVASSSYMIPVQSDSPFDIIFSNQSNLFGYSLETNEQTTILDWIETGFSITNETIIASLPDNHFLLFTGSRQKDDMWEADLYFLAPQIRENITENDENVITIGGYYFPAEIIQAVLDFNEANSMYKVKLIDYIDEAGGDWDAGILRLRTELITGKGPDIIYSSYGITFNDNIFVDLYPLIDADNEIARSDFIPNVLHAMEAPDGTIRTFSNRFQIRTMLGIESDLSFITSWTPSAMLAVLNENTHMPMPFGDKMDKEGLIRTMIAYSGNAYIDWTTRRANLDSENFIKILEASLHMPAWDDMRDYWNDNPPSGETRLRRREQLLEYTIIGYPRSYQWYIAAFDDVRFVGMPTESGGVNIITIDIDRIGINAASGKIQEAWSFLRKFLMYYELPELKKEAITVYPGFPLRIDLFNEVIKDAMTPIFNTADEPIDVGSLGVSMIVEPGDEIPNFSATQDNYIIKFYAMSQTDADNLREIIDNAKPSAPWVEPELWNLIIDDLNAFFAGGRSTTDTARIIQNRVQTYLDEQG